MDNLNLMMIIKMMIMMTMMMIVTGHHVVHGAGDGGRTLCCACPGDEGSDSGCQAGEVGIGHQ